jgi:hypothetical protein
MAELINYEVRIVKHESVVQTVQVYQKISDTGNSNGDGPVYGNVPTEKTIVIDTPILTQVIEGEKIDIKTVIKAINSL